ncbi:MAG: hypothetical protein MPJ78_11635 [Hyphomicrobiaceae bacterium]|nr:hypothetical protein [Hyphomicrobiaceae bacterium]
MPRINATFLVYSIIGALSQIIFTFLLIWLFSFRNFAAGIIYSKTETAQVAILGGLILGDPLSAAAVIGICVSLVGIMALSMAKTDVTFGNLAASVFGKTTLIGLGCGAALGLSVVLFRGAALSLGGEGFAMQAAFSLAVTLVMQTVMMGAYLAVRERDQLKAILVHWRVALLIGIAAVSASIFWRSAFTLQNAAYVRALGQIELVFAILATAIVFRERISRLEFVGMAFIVGGIFVLLFAGS